MWCKSTYLQKVIFNLIFEKCLGDHLAEKTGKKIPLGKRHKAKLRTLEGKLGVFDTWEFMGGGLEDEIFKTGNLSLMNVGLRVAGEVWAHEKF